MGESQNHQDLVQRTYRYLADRYPPHDGYAIFTDAPATPRGEKPRKIGGFLPDVLAMDVPTTFYAIGEAKTAADLENVHTAAQLRAFLLHLRVRGGVLVVTVPWAVAATARRMIAVAAEQARATAVEVVVLHDGVAWP